MKLNFPKVICLGFQKTGTSSIENILSRLGYRVSGYYQFRDLADRPSLSREILLSRAKSLLQEFDAVKDTPWPIFYREIYDEYPDARFILIEREPEKWIDSVVKDFRKYPNQIHEIIYGVPYPLGHEQVWLENYNTHNREVRDFFNDKPGSLLTLSLEKQFSIDAICDFLDKPRLAGNTPIANTKLKKTIKMFWWRLVGKI